MERQWNESPEPGGKMVGGASSEARGAPRRAGTRPSREGSGAGKGEAKGGVPGGGGERAVGGRAFPSAAGPC